MLPNLIKAGWLLCCICVFGWWLNKYGMNEALLPQLKAESVLLISIWMVILTFPLGVLWFISLNVIYYLAELTGLNLSGASTSEVIVIWVGFVAIGYLQWFKLLPFIIKKHRNRKASQMRSTHNL